MREMKYIQTSVEKLYGDKKNALMNDDIKETKKNCCIYVVL